VSLNKELTSYIVFGLLTTLVNMLVFSLLNQSFGWDYKLATTLAWLLSIMFAYVTNKIYVFKSTKLGFIQLMKELGLFVGFRVLSYFIDLGSMILLVEYLVVAEIVAKFVANGIVVVVNYITSKFLIFRSRKEDSHNNA
jgi:putative flippase GtrA